MAFIETINMTVDGLIKGDGAGLRAGYVELAGGINPSDSNQDCSLIRLLVDGSQISWAPAHDGLLYERRPGVWRLVIRRFVDKSSAELDAVSFGSVELNLTEAKQVARFLLPAYERHTERLRDLLVTN